MDADIEIQCVGLSKSYASPPLGLKRKKTLHQLAITVKKQEIYGIVGLNGAGKSTLLKLLMGFIAPDSGTISIGGHPATSAKSREHLGYLPENPCLYSNLSILDHLFFAGKITKSSSNEIKIRSREILQLVGLTDTVKLPLRKYSKGMTQRAALAYALFNNPKILILDEPMSGLDPRGRQLVVKIMKNFQQKGATILFCSHILHDVERICNRIGIMHNGKLIKTTTPNELKQDFPTNHSKHTTPLENCFFETISS